MQDEGHQQFSAGGGGRAPFIDKISYTMDEMQERQNTNVSKKKKGFEKISEGDASKKKRQKGRKEKGDHHQKTHEDDENRAFSPRGGNIPYGTVTGMAGIVFRRAQDNHKSGGKKGGGEAVGSEGPRKGKD